MPTVKTGDRVRITGRQPQDPAPMEIGSEGTVVEPANSFGQIMVGWDPQVARSTLLLEEDPFEVI